MLFSLSDPVFDALMREAFAARQNAYAPYSRFPVGAALLADSGKIYSGCNVENGSYGLTICAERSAVFKAVSEGEKRFTAIAIVADSEKPIAPCGACLQVLGEFQTDMMVIMSNTRFERRLMNINTLLPEIFRRKPE